METENIKLYNDDCFNIFKEIEYKSVDCVIVDLPYNQTSCKWDCAIDLDKMWIELKRICKKKCNYVFFCTTKFGYQLIKSNKKWFRYDLVWEKSRKVGFLAANKMPLRKHEMIYVFGDGSGGKKTYNPQKRDRKRKKTYYNDGIKVNNVYGDIELPKEIITYNQHHPDSVLKSTILTYKNPSKSVHRTQKPVDLCDFLVKSYSNEGDIVLDFTMGSGTTGISCKKNKRKFIGIEKDEKIFELAKKRIMD